MSQESLREALQEIVDWPRDDGLAAMCNQMRGRAIAALEEDAREEALKPEPQKDPAEDFLESFEEEVLPMVRTVRELFRGLRNG